MKHFSLMLLYHPFSILLYYEQQEIIFATEKRFHVDYYDFSEVFRVFLVIAVNFILPKSTCLCKLGAHILTDFSKNLR